jgi:hypothetical protein
MTHRAVRRALAIVPKIADDKSVTMSAVLKVRPGGDAFSGQHACDMMIKSQVHQWLNLRQADSQSVCRRGLNGLGLQGLWLCEPLDGAPLR